MSDSKSTARRASILDQLADYVLAEGLDAASLRPMAKALGTSDRMLLYYFKDKSELITATLERISERLVGVLMEQAAPHPLPLHELTDHLADLVFAETMWPYMRLWLDIASKAAGGDLLLKEIGGTLGRGFLAWGAAQIDSPTDQQRQRDAARLLATIEGAVLLKSLGLEDVARDALRKKD